ncbi:AAA domain-containing protein [Paucimonas lemoignei]|uniref:AAA domain-containing protein n=2 Tax=Paucimonas lemoignei TaxID=29443 RepID=A0A4R3HQG4_PAULE|nr:AAA domain-containing protein [Paucimonas lemoignei]
MDDHQDYGDGGLQWFAQIGRLEQIEDENFERKCRIMSEFEIHRATKRRAKLRLGMSGPAGSGKTYSALLIASGLGGRVGMIDTEHGSGDLYADLLPEGYDVLRLAPPFTPGRYIEAIRALEQAGVTTIIIDSLTHAWSGEGGSLDRQGKIADRSGNSWQAWRQVTPEHNALVEALLQSRCHIIATMRAKTEYVQEKDERTGKSVVRKIGLAPIMRDGIDYEFTIFMELDAQHNAYVGKDRTRLFDGQIIRPDVDTGRQLLAWLQSGEEEPAATPPALSEQQKKELADSISGARDLDELYRVFASAYRTANAVPDQAALLELTRLKDERKAALESAEDLIYGAHA